MREARKMFYVIVTLLLLGCVAGGCIGRDTEFTLRVVPPGEQQSPLRGTWQIASILKEDNTAGSPEPAEQWVGKTLQFADKKVLLGGYLLPGFRYQVKRVDAETYLRYRQQAFPADFCFKDKEIEVIALSDDYLFLCEFIRESDDELLLILFNTGYRAGKISDSVDEDVLAAAKAYGDLDTGSWGEQGSGYTGLLLGMCTPGEEFAGRQKDLYRTLWLSLENRKLAPVLETGAIIFPRKKGFYRLRIEGAGGLSFPAAGQWDQPPAAKGEDPLVAAGIIGKDDPGDADVRPEAGGVNEVAVFKRSEREEEGSETTGDQRDNGGGEGYVHRRICYIGNDYLSIEETSAGVPAGGGGDKGGRLYTVAIDDLPNPPAIKFSDLAGADAARTMEQGKQRLQGQLGLEQTDRFCPQDEESFGLVRKMGYWAFNGRLHYAKEGESASADYHIDAIPPSSVVFYNKLGIPWPRLKNYVPGALDAFTSPNMDLALIVTKNEILVYRMFQGNLAEPPLDRVPLLAGEKIIMAEWALGQYYVENWSGTLEAYLAAGEQ